MSLADRFLLARKTAPERMNTGNALTQSDLGRLLGVSRISIYNIENGTTKKPKDSTLLKASEAMQVEFAWLSRGEGPMDSERPDYTPPALASFSASRQKTVKPTNSEGRYTFTPVIPLETTHDNKGWQCIYPDIQQEPILTHLTPTTDIKRIRNEPVFNADVFLTKDDNGTILTAYILNTYLDTH